MCRRRRDVVQTETGCHTDGDGTLNLKTETEGPEDENALLYIERRNTVTTYRRKHDAIQTEA